MKLYKKETFKAIGCGGGFWSSRFVELSPADRAALKLENLGALRVLEELKDWLEEWIGRNKKWLNENADKRLTGKHEIIETQTENTEIVLHRIERIISKHLSPAAQDEMKKVLEKAKKWDKHQEVIRQLQKELGEFTKQVEEDIQITPDDRRRVFRVCAELRQEGDKK